MMGASVQRLRQEMDVKPTPRDKGLTLTLRVTAYDSGLLELDGVPITTEQGWLGVSVVTAQTLEEFQRQVQARRRQRGETA
jgi:hypothetical protein